MREEISTLEAPAAVGPYSLAVRIDGLLFTSGQIPLAPETGELIGDGIEDQARQVLANLDAVLRAGGSDRTRVIKTTMFLTDLANFAAVNAIYAEYFGATKPARSTIQVAALPKNAQVEIEAVALTSAN